MVVERIRGQRQATFILFPDREIGSFWKKHVKREKDFFKGGREKCTCLVKKEGRNWIGKPSPGDIAQSLEATFRRQDLHVGENSYDISCIILCSYSSRIYGFSDF